MATKKSFINKDRFKNLANISADEEKSEEVVSRFESSFSDDITKVDISKLEKSPDEWNFYSKLPDDKFLELMESIQNNELLHPIVVWERQDSYIILSGHNRVNAYKKLYEITQDEKYLKIPANIKKDIDEDTAKEIIIDTNWIQRQLSTYEKTQSILQKYVKIKKIRHKGEKTRDVIATHLGITGRMVQNYISLNSLKQEFFDMIDDGSINIKQAVQISRFNSNIQELILKNKEEIDFDINLLKKVDDLKSDDEILNILSKKAEQDDYIIVKYKIPKERKAEFDELYKEFMK